MGPLLSRLYLNTLAALGVNLGLAYLSGFARPLGRQLRWEIRRILAPETAMANTFLLRSGRGWRLMGLTRVEENFLPQDLH